MLRKPARTRRRHWVELLEPRRLLSVTWTSTIGGRVEHRKQLEFERGPDGGG